MSDKNIAELKKLLSYNKATGKFKWKKRKADVSFNSRFAGKEAGFTHVSGRGRESVAIKVCGKKYYAHILAVAFTDGSWPPDQVDHKNRNTFDNRRKNLRVVDDAENKKNLPRRSDNQSGCPGVCWSSSKKRWLVRIGGQWVGAFSRKSDAIAARKRKEVELGYYQTGN